MKKFEKNINLENLISGLVNVQDTEITIRCSYYKNHKWAEGRVYYVNAEYESMYKGDIKCSTLHSALNKAKKYLPNGKLDDINFNLISNRVEIAMGDWGDWAEQ